MSLLSISTIPTCYHFFSLTRLPPSPSLFPYTTLFRSLRYFHVLRRPCFVLPAEPPVEKLENVVGAAFGQIVVDVVARAFVKDRKSTRLNSSHRCISYAVFCLKKKKLTRTLCAKS